MRISYLREREPIDDILAKSLSKFWSERFGTEYKVSLRATRAAERALPGRPDCWVSNAWLNAIFPVAVRTAAMEPILREFSRSTVAWRRPLQKSYVKLATGRLSALQLSHGVMELSHPLPGWQDTVVVPGNHKLRILRHDEGCCFGILKHGFSMERFSRELAARQAASEAGVRVPKVLESSSNSHWFREEYIAATPLNRLADRQRQNQAALEAMQNLRQLTSATADNQCVGEYVTSRDKHARSIIDRSHLLAEQLKSELVACVEQLAERLAKFFATQFTTASSHGDFQPANLLIDASNVWIIDWEYADTRQATFDALTFASGSRSPRGLCSRLTTLLEAPTPDQTECIETLIPDNLDWGKRIDREFVLNLFCLEELCFHLQENDNELFRKLNHGFLQFVNELKGWLR